MQTETDAVNQELDRLDWLERWLADRIADLARVLAQPAPRPKAVVQNAAMSMNGYVRDFGAELIRIEQVLNQSRAAALAQADGGTTALPRAFQTLALRLTQARQLQNQWLPAHRLVLKQAEFGPVPLIPADEDIADTQAALTRANDGLLDVLHRIMNPLTQDAAAKATGAFADISFPFGAFMAHAQAARRVCLARGTPPPFRFLDVGCGLGLKVLAAQQVFETADGIEFDPGYARLAQSLLGQPAAGNGKAIEGDALEFEGYGTYDVIYFYHPIRDAGRMKALEQCIVGAAQPGTLIVAPYRGFLGRYRDLGCGQLSGSLYVVGRDADATAQLREKAEYHGPAARRIAPQITSPWEPLHAASFRNGFAVT